MQTTAKLIKKTKVAHIFIYEYVLSSHLFAYDILILINRRNIVHSMTHLHKIAFFRLAYMIREPEYKKIFLVMPV